MALCRNFVVALIAAIFLPATAPAQDNPEARAIAERSPDAIYKEVPLRMRESVCVAHLEVTTEGAHLREGHVLIMIGPIYNGSYLVMAARSGRQGTQSLRWPSTPMVAQDTELGNRIYLIENVSITEPGGEHPEADDHPMILQITEMKDGCPTELDIHGFQHMGVQGQHGGRAHASGG